jgi:hypothetical protein
MREALRESVAGVNRQRKAWNGLLSFSAEPLMPVGQSVSVRTIERDNA